MIVYCKTNLLILRSWAKPVNEISISNFVYKSLLCSLRLFFSHALPKKSYFCTINLKTSLQVTFTENISNHS